MQQKKVVFTPDGVHSINFVKLGWTQEKINCCWPEDIGGYQKWNSAYFCKFTWNFDAPPKFPVGFHQQSPKELHQ